uniref:Putative secreted protein n=1 Tax=Ixodes ricinus TaxID=34613 RepID=A0A6B0UK27_IXORI
MLPGFAVAALRLWHVLAHANCRGVAAVTSPKGAPVIRGEGAVHKLFVRRGIELPYSCRQDQCADGKRSLHVAPLHTTHRLSQTAAGTNPWVRNLAYGRGARKLARGRGRETD